MKKLVLAIVALALFPSCAGAVLDGSLSEAFDLTFQSQMIRRSPNAVQVSYLKSEGRETVIQLTIATAGLELKGGQEFDLGGEYAPGHPRAVVTRAVDGEPVRVLPPVARGRMVFDDPPDPGKKVGGSFNLSFGQGGDIGAGRTLNGTFDTNVEGTDY